MQTKPLDDHPPVRLLERFAAVFQGQPDFLVRAPGRVALLGVHTDYNEGWVLPAAITRYIWLAVRAIPASLVTIHALDLGEEVAFRLTELEEKKSLADQSLPEWALYPAGVAWSLQEFGLATPGSQIIITGDLQRGGGLASSAAVEVAYAMAWAHITGWQMDRMVLAKLCQRAENEYVGVESGLMDQFASAFGRPGCVLLFDTRTHHWDAIALPDDVVVVVADTSTRRTLVNSQYNQRRAECEQAVQALRAVLPGLRALRDVSEEQFETYQHLIPEPARQRAQHVIQENARVRAAADALFRGEAATLGWLMDDSFVSARDLFDASGPALNAMWEASQDHPARLGGVFNGAGWAGTMVFLAKAEGADDFCSYTARRYAEKTGKSPLVYSVLTADGAQILPTKGM